MVNHGISRGCRTCKKRKKKVLRAYYCDETKPTCKRCLESGRTCLGYQDMPTLHFRHYYAPEQEPVVEQATASRSEADETADPGLPLLDAFLSDFVVTPADPRVSRGFLHGMRELLRAAGPSSELAQAACVVETAVKANQDRRPDLLDEAARRYCSLLRSFHATLLRCAGDVSIQVLMTAVLLGLYERKIVSSDRSAAPRHGAHVKGVCALLCSSTSPLDLTGALQLFRLGNPLLLKGPLMGPSSHGVLCVPTGHDVIQNLDAVLVRCNPLFKRARVLLEDPSSSPHELEGLLRAALEVHGAFEGWTASQPDAWRPTTVYSVGDVTGLSSSHPFCWPGPVDVYADLYVAAVWNTYRKTHLMLLEIIQRARARLPRLGAAALPALPSIGQLAHDLAAALVASIPFHLAPSVPAYIRAVTAGGGGGPGADGGGPGPPAGRPVGGLLMLHPLWAVGRCSLVPPGLRAHAGRCLGHVGARMGIGQAGLLAEAVRDGMDGAADGGGDGQLAWHEGRLGLPFQQMAEGHILIFAGMLLGPAQVEGGGTTGVVGEGQGSHAWSSLSRVDSGARR